MHPLAVSSIKNSLILLTHFSYLSRMELLKQLMSIESPSGYEQKLAFFLQDYLECHDWNVLLQSVTTNESNEKTYNLYAYRSKGKSTSTPTTNTPRNPDVLFCSHLDCVPPILPIKEDEEYIYGRGACDAKNHIVAMIEAGNKLMNETPETSELYSMPQSVGLLFTAGEEVDHPGIRTANKLQLSPKIFIVGEPTEFHLIQTQKGCINGRIRASGIASHSGYPEYGDDATRKLIPVLRALYRLESRIPGCYVNAYISNGGIASNVLAEEAQADFCIRFNSDATSIINYLNRYRGNTEIYFDNITSAVNCDIVPGFPVTNAGFMTDLDKFIPFNEPNNPNKSHNMKRFIYGGGSILDAHTEHEKIAKADLYRAANDYIKIVEECYKIEDKKEMDKTIETYDQNGRIDSLDLLWGIREN